jgi:hypothetical protein
VKEKIVSTLKKPSAYLMEENKAGRTKIWSCWTSDADEIGFLHLRQVACILREIFDTAGVKVSKEAAVLITSANRSG